MNESRKSTRNLGLSLAVLVCIFATGTVGFKITGGRDRTWFDAVFITAHTVTTVGDSRVQHLSMHDRVWELILIIAGISTALYAASTLVVFMVDGELRDLLGRSQLRRSIKRMRNHFIVCGFGRMGQVLCEQLSHRHVPFVLIERDPELVAIAEEAGYPHIGGDALNEHVLEEAGIVHAKGLASCLGDDASNVFATLCARGMNANLTIIARAENVETEPKLRRAGADKVVCPAVIGGRRITQMLIQPAVDELLELTVAGPDLEISKVQMVNLPKAVGPTLQELGLPARTGLMVVAVLHADGRRQLNPPADWKLLADDQLIVIGPSGGVDRMLEHFG